MRRTNLAVVAAGIGTPKAPFGESTSGRFRWHSGPVHRCQPAAGWLGG
jgi:hypothetical protein